MFGYWGGENWKQDKVQDLTDPDLWALARNDECHWEEEHEDAPRQENPKRRRHEYAELPMLADTGSEQIPSAGSSRTTGMIAIPKAEYAQILGALKKAESGLQHSAKACEKASETFARQAEGMSECRSILEAVLMDNVA